MNEEIGREIFDYNRFPENQDNSIVISYKNVSILEYLGPDHMGAARSHYP